MARAKVAAWLVAPILALWLLPSPRAAMDHMHDARASVALGAVAQLTALLVIWGLLTWTIAVCVAATAGRLPGAIGARGRQMLAAITPTAARRVVIAAAGISLTVGVAACGTDATPALASVPTSAMPPTSITLMATSPAMNTATSITHARPSGAARPPRAEPTPGTSSSARAKPASGDAPTGGVELPDLDWPTPSSAPSTAVPIVATARDTAAPSATSSRPARAIQATQDVPTASAASPPTAPATERSTPDAAAPDAATGADTKPEIVIVRPGDCLWSLAAARLPTGAGVTAIDEAWHAWYATNRAVIGPNPNLIRPGQHLQVPTVMKEAS